MRCSKLCAAMSLAYALCYTRGRIGVCAHLLCVWVVAVCVVCTTGLPLLRMHRVSRGLIHLPLSAMSRSSVVGNAAQMPLASSDARHFRGAVPQRAARSNRGGAPRHARAVAAPLL